METKRKKISGIYVIENLINGYIYIGQSIDILSRLKVHARKLKTGRHFNIHLQRAFDKYGEKNFQFIPVLLCDSENLDYYEQLLVDNFSSITYNICKECVTTSKGVSPSKKAIDAVIASNKRRKGSKISKYKINENGELVLRKKEKLPKIKKPRKHTEEYKRKMSDNQTGEKNSFYNKKHTPETIQTIIAKAVGDKRKKDCSSEYVGVCFRKSTGLWRSFIVYKGKHIEIGQYKTEKEAAIARNEKAIELYGGKAKLNIIIDNEEKEE